MTPAISMKRAGALYGISFCLMVILSLVFALRPGTKIDIPSLSTAISIFAVMVPAIVACYWPKNGAPGALPSFKAPNPWVLGGAALFSLPLYVVFASLQIGITKILPVHLDTKLVAPLTATSPLIFMWFILSVAILPALSEELFYRGVMQSAAVRKWGPWIGVAVTAVLFSIVHMELAGGLSRILMGLWFGFLFLRTGSLWPGVVAHALNNSWGVVLVNWHKWIEAELNTVFGIAGVCFLLGLACFYKAGYFAQWLPGLAATDEPKANDGPELPYFITVARPEQPRTDK